MPLRYSVRNAGAGGGAEQITVGMGDECWAAVDSATGTRTATLSGNGRGVGQMLALKPESYPLAALS